MVEGWTPYGRVSFDNRVTPPTAARVLGISEWTLRHWRDEKRGPTPLWRQLWGYSWSYDIRELYEYRLKSAM
jgi:hypothetical protein